jgi:hypothetical protein
MGTRVHLLGNNLKVTVSNKYNIYDKIAKEIENSATGPYKPQVEYLTGVTLFADPNSSITININGNVSMIVTDMGL